MTLLKGATKKFGATNFNTEVSDDDDGDVVEKVEIGDDDDEMKFQDIELKEDSITKKKEGSNNDPGSNVSEHNSEFGSSSRKSSSRFDQNFFD